MASFEWVEARSSREISIKYSDSRVFRPVEMCSDRVCYAEAKKTQYRKLCFIFSTGGERLDLPGVECWQPASSTMSRL